MVITEVQAQDQWCPFTGGKRSTTMEVLPAEVLPPEMVNCIASRCMAWIWVTQPAEHPEEERKGCCGLAHTRRGGEYA